MAYSWLDANLGLLHSEHEFKRDVALDAKLAALPKASSVPSHLSGLSEAVRLLQEEMALLSQWHRLLPTFRKMLDGGSVTFQASTHRRHPK